MEARLQKIIAQWGIASRREAEEMIQQSRVRINGILAHLGQKVDPQRDIISIDGKTVSEKQRPALIYLLLYKPLGVVSTCYDPQGRPTVISLLPPELQTGSGIHPVGRLDVDSTGALILTNDGDLTFGLTHPSHSIAKTYHVLVKGHPPGAIIKMWQQGVILEARKTRPAKVSVIKRFADTSRLEIILQEGRNRQIRRIAEKLGYPVVELHRTAIGSIQLQTPKAPLLQPGNYRYLTKDEIVFLKDQIKSVHKKN
ncbi:pseudouridine synthase [Cronbergia sp. UHCC 0137]|uniref:pseudouridine synthase n=1 Tax=Cronbergia sp. UHCC 0137 TaxID=3110239 RepID=UPI002B20BE85|nr:pseudouridine synthase [Cronbergia sp. UHCC 0137]MEA5620242.1 pseudouridine synthase [Cronbergia sp. UHCC 0137]